MIMVVIASVHSAIHHYYRKPSAGLVNTNSSDPDNETLISLITEFYPDNLKKALLASDYQNSTSYMPSNGPISSL
jgi:hypothetical protein